ncbi:MAG: NAD(P)-dependent oxidoreductase [Anaerolineae bacterium]
MRITIFGATGRTGQRLIDEALDAGYDVTAFAWTPSKLEIDHERLTIVQGDVTDADAVEQAVAFGDPGADAVLSVLGPSGNQPTYAISRGMENIVEAMKTHDVDRLVVSMGAGVSDPQDNPRLVNRILNIVLKLLAANVYRDMKRVADVVRASDLDWTLVRVPMLSDENATGKVKVGYVGDEQIGPRLTRGDLARFMLEQVTDDTYIHEAPVISN